MWPPLLDMTKDESIQNLRNLELEAYSHLISALRAQGPLNPDKRKLLKETGNALNISQERHKAEIRRALSDEKLNTICYHVNNSNEFNEEWALEGRRTISLVPRMPPQTGYSVLADEIGESANQISKLPLSIGAERKRLAVGPTNQLLSGDGKQMFKISEGLKHEENKKRKLSICPENSTLAQHLLGTSKLTRIQQIYKQKVKPKLKDQSGKSKSDEDEPSQDPIASRLPNQIIIPKHPQTFKIAASVPSTGSQKINLISSVNLQPATVQDITEPEQKLSEPSQIVSSIMPSNENRDKIITTLKSNNNITFKTLSGVTSTPVDLNKLVKCAPSRKITKTVRTATGQKLIVVSNTQTIPTSSFHRTLTIPFVKNISVKNFDKFKIVTTAVTTTNITTTVVNSSTFNSAKHKVVTVKTNPTGTKKMIPVTQLQVFKKGNIKVLPIGGKILGKASTSTTSSPVYIMNTVGGLQTYTRTTTSLPTITTTKESVPIENHQEIGVIGKNDANENGEIQTDQEKLKRSEKMEIIEAKDANVRMAEDYDAKIDEFHIQTIPVVECAAVIDKSKNVDDGKHVEEMIKNVKQNDCSLEEIVSVESQDVSDMITEPETVIEDESKVSYVKDIVTDESENVIAKNNFPQQTEICLNSKIDYQSN